MTQLVTRFRQVERGQGVVEFAFTVPILLLVSVGLVTLGMAATASVNANNAANYAARRASVEQSNPAGVAYTAAWEKLNQASIGDYTVSVVASGVRGSLVQVRVGYSVPNFFAGLIGFFGGEMSAEISGDAVSYFRAEGW